MATGDDFLWPPETFEDNQDPNLAQKLTATVDIIFAQLRRLQSSAGGSGLPEPAVNGDLLRRASGAWERLAIGAAGQALIDVLGLPAWSNDGHALLIDASNIDQGTLPAARYPHNLLSTPHTDTTPASPTLGDLVLAQRSAALDVDRCFLDGLPYDSLPNSNDAGAEAFWLDGLPADGLASTSVVLWQRKANGTPGYVLTAGATGPDWQPSGSSSNGTLAAIYKAAAFVVSDATLTAVSFDSVTSDSLGFFTLGSPTRLTVPVGQGGSYGITGQATWVQLTGRRVYARLYVNGVMRAESGGDVNTTSVSAVVTLNAGDFVELKLFMTQDVAGTTETVSGGAGATFLEMARFASESTVATDLPSPVAGAIVKGNSASTAYERLVIGAAGRVLRSDGSAPAWAAATAVISSVATGAQNDWAPGLVGDTIIVWTGGADLTVTGFAAGYTGQRLVFVNAGSFVAAFTPQSGASAAGNKLRTFVTAGSLPVAARGAAIFDYDGTDWRLVSLQPNGVAIAFNAGNFTASGTMAWTVEVGDQISYAWTVKESLMTVIWYIQTTSVTAPLSNELRIALPAGFTIGTQFVAPCFAIPDTPTSAVHETCIAFGAAGNSYFGVFRLGAINWIASVNNCATWGTVSFLL